MKKLLVFIFLLLGSSQLFADDFKEGVNYKAISPQPTDSGDKIEVLEFFWYGCPHCYAFEPYLSAWKKKKPANVEFVRIPAIFRPDWEAQARAYYALGNMGLIDDLHGKIFNAIHKEKRRLNSLDMMADFLSRNGVDRKKFMAEANSFAVDAMVRKAKKKQTAYRIQGVPTIAVNGKYVSSGSMAGSYENLIKIMDKLIKKEEKGRGKGKH